MAPTVLIYSTIAAQRYADLVRPQLPGFKLIPCATPAEAEAHVAEADILFAWRFPPELYAKAERLRWVQAMGAGIEDLITAPIPADIPITRVVDQFGGMMSEYAFAHMLSHAQQLPRLAAAQAERRWEPFRPGRLEGKRLGVAGAGSIGTEVARKGKAFGMEVWALVRNPRPVEYADRVFGPADVAEFTGGIDYLVSVLPLTPDTKGLINPMQMKEGAVLINIGRGATIAEDAILEAVRTRQVQVVLDVFAAEPLPQDHPFWTTPGITVTPHISGPSVPAEVAALFAENCRRFVAGEPLLGVVDRKRGY